MPRTYDDFVLEFVESESGALSVSVVRSSAGECSVAYNFPFDTTALELRLKDLQIALLRSGGNRRRVLLPEESAVQDFGAALYDSVFTGEVRSLLEESRRRASAAGHGVRLRLRFASAQLATLPWEYFFDTRIGDFVALATDTPIVRHLSAPGSIDALSIDPPLRILGMIASPANLPPIDVRAEQATVERSLRGLIDRGIVELHWVQGQGWRDLRQRIREQPWHVVHFMGHGAFDTTAREGVVYFADENGQADSMGAVELNRILSGNRALRLVLLNSCLGGGGDGHDVFSSTAATLIRGGIPAVIAMQYEITDTAATEFARTFYDAIVDGLPVDAAVDEGRRAISVGIANSLEWGIPVLYMRSADGRIFDVARRLPTVQPTPASPTTPVEPPVRTLPVPIPAPSDPAPKLDSPNDATVLPDVNEDNTKTPGIDAVSDHGKRRRLYYGIFALIAAALLLFALWTLLPLTGDSDGGVDARASASATQAVVNAGATLAATSPWGDEDDDGLANSLEVNRYGTNPFDPDTDKDGLMDGDEVEVGLDPRSPDSDGDDRTDVQEIFEDGTDPTNWDSDGDGAHDGLEYELGTDPNNSDTDGDGLTDHDEFDRLGTNPTKADTDGDGVSDYEEVRAGSDPLSAQDLPWATSTPAIQVTPIGRRTLTAGNAIAPRPTLTLTSAITPTVAVLVLPPFPWNDFTLTPPPASTP